MKDDINTRFIDTNCHPNNCQLDSVGSALHSLCVAKNLSWVDSYGELIKASGELGQMPQYKKTICAMLTNNGFYQQPGSATHRSVSEIIDECNDCFSDGEVIILNLKNSKSYVYFVPIVPICENGSTHYVLQCPSSRCLYSTAYEMWIAWKDGQDHSVKKR